MPRRRRSGANQPKETSDVSGKIGVGNRVRASSSSTGRRGFNLLESLGREKFPQQPKPVMAKMYSGRIIGTDIVEDRVLTGRPSVFIVASNGCNWVNFNPTAYLFGGFTTGDTDITNEFGTFSKSLYSQICRVIEAQRLRVLRDTILDNANPTNTDSFGYFMQQYTNAFWGLRGLAGWVNAGNFNMSTALISNTINQVLMRLKADLDRLNSIPMSPSYMRAMDRLCGPKALDADSVVVGMQWGFGSVTTDMTQLANIQAMLTNMETALNNILASPPVNMGADMNRILNTLAIAYGETAPFEPKEIVIGPEEYGLFATQAISYLDTTALKLFSQPTSTLYVGGALPILIPKDADHSSECVQQYLSLWRPAAFSKDAVAGIANTSAAGQFGITGNNLAVGHGTDYLVYGQNGIAGANFFQGTGATGFAEVALTDLMPFGVQAAIEFNNLGTEVRTFRDWDIYYVPLLWQLEETLYSAENWFIHDMVGRSQ